jgi:protein involved in ribonucleotide reduction
MKAIVVYESMYGNTRHIAQAIAEGLRASIDAEVVPVDAAGAVDVTELQLVVVGAPTHAWSLSRRGTREAAAKQIINNSDRHIAAGAVASGVREWMRGLQLEGRCFSAAFDTRLDRPKLFTGSAVRAIERGLVAAGFAKYGPSQSFRVRGTMGPLAFGEIERARNWGEDIGHTISSVAVANSPERTAGQ